ncbi:MAG: histidinol phosphatase, partial [Desulfosporosinus sp.]|nr:histidinol phosphatase [Desulfosporosinus sp.]
MLIDLHCHTKKTKTGEADTRDVSKEIFLDKVDEANVKLVAITNHNHFDYEQYIEFEEIAKETCMVWPGIEFDVECNGIRGHIITISDPDKVEEFNDLVQGLLGDTSPDQFYVDISLLSETFDDLGVLFIAHFNKSEELPLNDLHSFEQTLTKAILFKEPAKLISIGILATHGHLAILGSDVKDWDDYYNCNFAEIKFEISGYNQFIQLAKKNPHMVKHFLDISFKYDIQVYPHQNTKITIPIYNDINTIIGDKGTGKTEIIKSLETYFNQEDINNTVYRGGDKEKWYEDLI